MKIAFIEPSVAMVEPLGIMYLSETLMNKGYEVKYFETPRKNFFERLKKFNPDVLAYSVTTGKHKSCRNLNSVLRKHLGTFSIFGGPHCTFYPEFIESDPMIDGVCRGEGEDAIVELIDRLANGKNYTNIANWWLRHNGNIFKNDIRDKIKNLDSIPFPNREIIYSENRELGALPIKRIFTSRGCPYACSYCFNKKYNSLYQGKGKIYRQRSPSKIVEEVVAIKEKYPLTFLKICDDIFGMEMNYEEFVNLYKKHVGIPFLCNIRPNLIDEKRVTCLKESGCVAVNISIESGNEFIRNKILNRNLSYDALKNAILILKKHDIRIWTQNIIGNPGETFEMTMETYILNVKHKIEYAECFLLAPYIGTDIYNYCVENKYFDGNVESLPKSYWLDSTIRFVSEKERRKFVNFHKFFSFAVQHPKALPFIMLLIKLPPNMFFIAFNRIYDAWRVSRLVRAKFNVNNFFSTVIVNLKNIFSYFLRSNDNWSTFKTGK